MLTEQASSQRWGRNLEARLNRKTFLENLAEEFRDELYRCDWEMTDELVSSAVSVYLKARVRKIDTIGDETTREREKRLEKKREQSKRYRAEERLRDVSSEVFGGHGGAMDVAAEPVPPRGASVVALSPRSGFEDRLERIQELAERNRRHDKH